MVNVRAKVPALILVGATLVSGGCGPGSRSEGGEESGLVGEARARPSGAPSPASAAPLEEVALPVSDRPVGPSSAGDTEGPPPGTPRAATPVGAPEDEDARPTPSAPRTLPAPSPSAARLKPRVERRPSRPFDASSPIEPGGSTTESEEDTLPDEPEVSGAPFESSMSEAREPGVVIPAGSRIPLEMVTRLSSATSWPGDRFRARVVEDVLAEDGLVLVPRGAVLEGVVSRAVRGDAGDEREPVLDLEPRALLMSGRVYDLHARVAEAELERKRDGRDMAGKAAAGAAAGAILGKVLGKDAKSTIAGAVAGAAAGAAVGVVTGEAELILDEGAPLVVVVQRDLPLEEVAPRH